jgi:hypothetical protein
MENSSRDRYIPLFFSQEIVRKQSSAISEKLLSQKYFVNFFHKYVHLSYRALRLVVQQIQRVGRLDKERIRGSENLVRGQATENRVIIQNST